MASFVENSNEGMMFFRSDPAPYILTLSLVGCKTIALAGSTLTSCLVLKVCEVFSGFLESLSFTVLSRFNKVFCVDSTKFVVLNSEETELQH